MCKDSLRANVMNAIFHDISTCDTAIECDCNKVECVKFLGRLEMAVIEVRLQSVFALTKIFSMHLCCISTWYLRLAIRLNQNIQQSGTDQRMNLSTDLIYTLRLRQNCRRFADDILKCIFFNVNVWISIKISLKFVSNGPINNNPAFV